MVVVVLFELQETTQTEKTMKKMFVVVLFGLQEDNSDRENYEKRCL